VFEEIGLGVERVEFVFVCDAVVVDHDLVGAFGQSHFERNVLGVVQRILYQHTLVQLTFKDAHPDPRLV